MWSWKEGIHYNAQNLIMSIDSCLGKSESEKSHVPDFRPSIRQNFFPLLLLFFSLFLYDLYLFHLMLKGVSDNAKCRRFVLHFLAENCQRFGREISEWNVEGGGGEKG